MKSEIGNLYEDINKLLNDICELLSEEVNNNGISLKNRHVANHLIERSKKQLYNISRIVSSTTDNDSGSYMDMNKAPEYIDPDKTIHEESHEIYTDVDATIALENAPKDGQIICPYESTSAQELPNVTKCGYLERRERFFFIEHQKRIYIAITKPWMLIFSCERDQKPNEVLDLRMCQVKSNENQKDSKKKEEKCFELSCPIKSKSYHLTASTLKDMLQWVAEIERANPMYQNAFINQVSRKTMEYDDEENIYEKLKDDDIQHEPNINRTNRMLKQTLVPNLPPRVIKNHYIIERPVPSIPVAITKPKENPILHKNRLSIEEEDVYDALIVDPLPEPATLKNRIAIIQNPAQNVPNSEDEEDVEYDVIQADLTQTAPNNESSVKESVVNQTATVSQDFDDDSDEVYDVIQTTDQVQMHDDKKNTNTEEGLKVEDKTLKIKPEVPKVKPKIFNGRQNNKVSNLVQQLTKKSKT